MDSSFHTEDKDENNFFKLCTSLTWWKDYIMHLIQDPNRPKGWNYKNISEKHSDMRQKVYIIKITSHVYLTYIRSNLSDFALVIFALRIPFSESRSTTIRFQKDTLPFKEGGTYAKPCVSSSSETKTASHFKRLCLVEAKYF